MRTARSILMILILSIAGAALHLARPAFAQTGNMGVTTTAANMRTGPGRNYPTILGIPPNTAMTLEARNAASTWLLSRTSHGIRGWLLVQQINLSGAIASLPVSDEVVDPSVALAPSPAPADPPGQDSVAANDAAPDKAAATRDPVVYAAKITPAVQGAMRGVYYRGLAMGNNPHVFSKVGDCLAGHVWFLNQFGDGNPNNLGQYTYLQKVIDYYSVSPRPGVLNSFTTASQAAHSAFTSASVRDPEWSDPAVCKANESPLECELRVNKPSVAIVMFGVVDVQALTTYQFNAFLRQIVNEILAHGTIPILTLAPENPTYAEKAHAFNRQVLALSREKNLPLINLAGALASWPDKGLDPDGIHLTPGAGFGRVSFEGSSMKQGLTIWNLLALQSLYNVWQQVLQ